MKSNTPLVSVIICTHNRADLVTKAVQSVINQNYINIEIIIVDDFSNDNTDDIISNINDKRISYIKNSSNLGVSRSSNIGFSKSKGDYIALLGDDDHWTDVNKLNDQLELFSNVPNLGIVGTWWVEQCSYKTSKKKPKRPRVWELAMLSGGGVICGSTPLISRNAWIDVGGFDENLKRGTDSNLFRRIILHGYKGEILRKFTTVVDVNPNRKRLTPTNSIDSISRGIHSLEYNLKTLSKHYDVYPKAKSIYYYKLGSLHTSLYQFEKNIELVYKATSYFRKSFKTKFLHIIGFKAMIKYFKYGVTKFDSRIRNT